MTLSVKQGVDDREEGERAPSFPINDPSGREIRIPASPEEDREYFSREQKDQIRNYFRENGYVVVRGLIPRSCCETALDGFRQEVANSDGYIYRQTTANPERHVFTPHGFMLNPILNVQSLSGRHYPRFRHSGLEVMTHPNVQQVLGDLFGEPGKLVQSMFFEGNSATWAHQDTYYLDSEQIGGMTAAWFALEDIAPGAGRFYVYPGSHLIDMPANSGEIDVAFNHDRYKAKVIELIRQRDAECRAPALQQGDVLFWSSKTVHGSLETRQPERSRCSFTAHYIPASSAFLQFQSRIRNLNLHQVGDMLVHKPKNLDRPVPRAVLWIETTFPKTFRLTKKVAIKALTR